MNVRLIRLVIGVATAVIGLFLLAYNVDFSAKMSRSETLNNKYPLTDPLLTLNSSKYRIAIISDLDENSMSKNESNTWLSFLKQGYLTYYPRSNDISIEWDSENSSKIFKSHLSMKGRGLELSELVTFNGQLITIDDKTGMVYKIDGDKLIPWVILVEGDGNQTTFQKNEWATVKDSKLYVGSVGHEYTKPNRPTILLTMWVKEIDQDGRVKHLNWTENYIKVRAAFKIHFPGYMTHESCVWSDVHGQWFFLPRKASIDPYNKTTDPRKATNVLLTATPDFSDIKVINVGDIVENHGYSSFKFVPGTKDTIITAIKTIEDNQVTATYVTAFTIEGKIIYPETQISDKKFEGFEFI